MLKKSYPDIKISTCYDPVCAIKELKKTPYDIVISDYLMPYMNGIDFLKIIRKENLAKAFILFTGQGEEEVAMLALNEGADFYLIKKNNFVAVIQELTYYIKRIEEKYVQERLLKEKDHQLEIANKNLSQMINQLETILAGINTGIYALGLSGELIYVNKKGANDLGYKTPQEMIADKSGGGDVFRVLDVYNPSYFNIAENKFKFPIASEMSLSALNLISTKKLDKSNTWITKKVTPLFNSNHELEMVLIFTNDISDLVEEEIKFENELRLSNLINETLDVIFDYKDNKDLTNRMCKMLVENGDFILAWIGEVEDQFGGKFVRPIAFYGFEDNFLKDLIMSWDESKSGETPTIEAIKNSRVRTINDIARLENIAWKKSALKRGYKSCLAVPFDHIHPNDLRTKTCVITVFGKEVDLFHEPEKKTFSKIADLVSYALKSTIKYTPISTQFERALIYFDKIPIPMVYYDFSQLMKLVNNKRAEGIDIRRNLDFEDLNEIQLISIKKINDAYIEFFEKKVNITPKKDIIRHIEDISNFISSDIQKDILLSILDGKKSFNKLTKNQFNNSNGSKLLLKIEVDPQIVEQVGVIIAIIEVPK